MSLDEMNAFREAAPTSNDDPELDAKARAWLSGGGIEVTTGDGPACTLVCLQVDEDGECRVFALPGDMVDEATHRDLAALNGSAFAHYFTMDLAPEQFGGAFRVLGGSAEEEDVFQEQVEELRGETEDAVSDMDWDALVEGAGSWNEHELKSGATLPGPVSHVYTARLCM